VELFKANLALVMSGLDPEILAMRGRYQIVPLTGSEDPNDEGDSADKKEHLQPARPAAGPPQVSDHDYRVGQVCSSRGGPSCQYVQPGEQKKPPCSDWEA